jgi:hypothetical protein
VGPLGGLLCGWLMGLSLGPVFDGRCMTIGFACGLLLGFIPAFLFVWQAAPWWLARRALFGILAPMLLFTAGGALLFGDAFALPGALLTPVAYIALTVNFIQGAIQRTLYPMGNPEEPEGERP